MTLRGSSEPPAPALFHVKTAEMLGRGERIRTSGPCLPNALLLHSHLDFLRFPVHAACARMPHVPARFTAEGSKRAFGPCLSKCP